MKRVDTRTKTIARRALPASPTATDAGNIQVIHEQEEEQRMPIKQRSDRSLEEDADDEYDDYEDDFEEQEPVEMMQAVPKIEPSKKVISNLQPAKKSSGGSVKISQMEALQKAVKNENAVTAQRRKEMSLVANEIPQKAEAKNIQITESFGAKKKQAKNTIQRQAKYSMRPATSRSIQALDPRIKKARALRQKLQMSAERYVALDIAPLTPHQVYLQKLRAKDTNLREAATTHTRINVECSTDPIETKTKEMQFALGDDDTDFYNLMYHNKQKLQSAIPYQNVNNSQGRLSAFVLTAAPVIESLLLEKDENKHDDCNDDYVTKIGLEIQGTKGVITATARPTLLLVIENQQLSLWETNLQRKLATLHCEGEPTVATFATPHGSVVCAGIDTGTLLFWDLRTRTNAMVTQDACITTAAYAQDDNIGHRSTVVAIYPLLSDALPFDRNILRPTQIISLDDRGLLCTWMLTEATKADFENELSTLKLTQIRKLYTWASNPLAALGAAGRTFNKEIEHAPLEKIIAITGPGPLVIRAVPSQKDTNESFIICTRGSILRCSQYGNVPKPSAYYISTQALMQASYFTTRPLCIDISSLAQEFFLVGCDDGSCTLHSIDMEIPILRFTPAQLGTNCPVLDLAWSKHRPAVFFILYQDGSLAVYDLLQGNIPCSFIPGQVKINFDTESPTTQDSKQHDDDFFLDGLSIATPSIAGGPTPQIALSAGSKQHGFIAIQYDGSTCVRGLSKRALIPVEDELTKLRAAVEEAVNIFV
uniref:WD repeat-containing protein 60 n=1 Tax=Aureoumbra lagunensis TaxID=44058 RepID=A0A7S3JP91_9STRA|mmetsp:Transcript_12707/g.19063  ORF Transcript_12707/g.19063 Transcript_12707/m.19063 type:complete len:765 (+) Transcript_12707:30-2324(+)